MHCADQLLMIADTPALLHCTCHFVYKDACFLYNQLCNAHRYRHIKLHVCQKCIPPKQPRSGNDTLDFYKYIIYK